MIICMLWLFFPCLFVVPVSGIKAWSPNYPDFFKGDNTNHSSAFGTPRGKDYPSNDANKFRPSGEQCIEAFPTGRYSCITASYVWSVTTKVISTFKIGWGWCGLQSFWGNNRHLTNSVLVASIYYIPTFMCILWLYWSFYKGINIMVVWYVSNSLMSAYLICQHPIKNHLSRQNWTVPKSITLTQT